MDIFDDSKSQMLQRSKYGYEHPIHKSAITGHIDNNSVSDDISLSKLVPDLVSRKVLSTDLNLRSQHAVKNESERVFLTSITL